MFTEEQPVVPIYPGLNREQVQKAIENKIPPDYMGTFTGVKRYVMHTFVTTQSQLMKKRAAQYMLSNECPLCHSKRLQVASLSVKFAGLDITEMSRQPLEKLAEIFTPFAKSGNLTGSAAPKRLIVAQRIPEDLIARLSIMLDLGLGYLTVEIHQHFPLAN